MKLQNKKTGEIGVLNVSNNEYYVLACELPLCGNSALLGEYDTLDALMQEWKDYEKPKPYFISEFGDVYPIQGTAFDRKRIEKLEQIGNKFKTEEEAEKAVEKLKAWKRLKDKGFKFTGFSGGSTFIEFTFDKPGEPGSAYKDLDLLFGGEDA